MNKNQIRSEISESRRNFIEKAGKVSVAAPAAAVLLSRGAHAQAIPLDYQDEDSTDITDVTDTTDIKPGDA